MMTVARMVAVLLLVLTTGCARSDQSKVEAVLKKMEHAEQTGDFNTWVELWTGENSLKLKEMRPDLRPRPEVRYRPIKTFIQGDEAVLLVKAASGSDSFATMTLRKEGGRWKVQDEVWSNTEPDANSVYAVLPPEAGAFTRAGSPWDHVAPGLDASDSAHLGYQLKAVFDESYLYIRIESNTDLPAPGSTIEERPGGWPNLRIDTAGAGEFVLYDGVGIGDQATFDQKGLANSHRHFAAYMIRLERNHHEVFSASADLHPSPLLAVAGRDYDIRIPLATMGITDSRATTITISDAQWPSTVQSIAVKRYAR